MSVFESPAIHDEFCGFAPEMRAAFEAHFADPYAMTPPQHFIWNYWHVPGRYTYLRSELAAVLGRDLASRFMRHLETWSLLRYGLKPRVPWLSLYVNGCEQGLHNDASNGRLAYVYSLTRWQERRFSGGDTLLLRPEARSAERQTRPSSLGDLMQAVSVDFNRLILFDDRLPHGVARLSGTMAPAEGRLVIHGHLVETEPVLIGALPDEALQSLRGSLVDDLQGIGEQADAALHGVVTLRADVARTGVVANARVLADLGWVLAPEGEARKRTAIAQALSRLESIGPLPQAQAPSVLIAALRWGQIGQSS
jgi:hypothetical protein